MENIIKKLKSGAKHTRLASQEKAEIKSALLRYVNAHPVNKEAFSGHSVSSPYYLNNFRNKKGISILVIGSLLMGGTVSFAAENSLPGDALFTVKVHVNENVRGTLAVTPKAKAEWEVLLVERRLEEVEKLAVIPDVAPVVQQIADENLERYSKRVKNRIEKFEEDEDDEDAIEIVASLSQVYSTHEQVLLRLDAREVMAVSDIATTTVVVATTTQVASGKHAESDSIKGALKKVKGARDEVEKKHEELKEKYKRTSSSSASVIPASAQTSDKNETQTTRESKGHKSDKPKKEEIRASVVNEEKSEERGSKKRENINFEREEKEEDND